MLQSCGFCKPTTKLSLNDRPSIVQTITLHFVLLQSKAEIDQYVEGLKSLGVLDVIREHPGLLQSFFCKTEDTLTAGTVI